MRTRPRTLASILSLALVVGAPSFALAQQQSTTGGYRATQTQPATPEMWDPQRVEQRLKELGYGEIGDLREEEGQWRFTTRRELAFDPQTGQVAYMAPDPIGGYRATQLAPAPPQWWDPKRVEERLREMGYTTDLGQLREENGRLRLDATREGQTVFLLIDPQTGEVFAQQRIGTLRSDPAGD